MQNRTGFFEHSLKGGLTQQTFTSLSFVLSSMLGSPWVTPQARSRTLQAPVCPACPTVGRSAVE